jgi:hypothetical protein
VERLFSMCGISGHGGDTVHTANNACTEIIGGFGGPRGHGLQDAKKIHFFLWSIINDAIVQHIASVCQ